MDRHDLRRSRRGGCWVFVTKHNAHETKWNNENTKEGLCDWDVPSKCGRRAGIYLPKHRLTEGLAPAYSVAPAGIRFGVRTNRIALTAGSITCGGLRFSVSSCNHPREISLDLGHRAHNSCPKYSETLHPREGAESVYRGAKPDDSNFLKENAKHQRRTSAETGSTFSCGRGGR